jgi:hypothetical protein
MKVLTKYQCEMCKHEYLSPEETLNCESKGKEIPLCQEGTIVSYRDDWNGGFGTCYHDLTVYEIHDYGHYLDYELGTEYDIIDGKMFYSPCEYVSGNKEFLDKCKIVNPTPITNTTL